MHAISSFNFVILATLSPVDITAESHKILVYIDFAVLSYLPS